MLRPEGCVKLEGMEPAAVIQGDKAYGIAERQDTEGRKDQSGKYIEGGQFFEPSDGYGFIYGDRKGI